MPSSPDQNQPLFDRDSDPRQVPKADQGAYNLTPSQAATTAYSGSMAAPTVDYDAQSRLSTYTYSSTTDAQKFLKKVGDRSWNVLTETYFLPADDDEWARLDKQHVAFKIGMGGLCPDMSTVRAILAPEAGVRKRIVDLGCGTGVWAHEMAAEFPECRVLGVDVAPVPVNEETLSENCSFEIDDINLGLSHFRGEPLDVCHGRLIASGLKDYRKTMQEVHACLRPGGLAVWVDVDYHLMTSDEHVYLQCASDEDPSGSWTARIFYELRRAAVKTGKSDIYGMADALDEGLWNDPLMDPETCKAASLYLPIGTWLDGKNIHETQQLKYIGAIMRQDLMITQKALHTVLGKAGWSQTTLDAWSQKADEEMMSNKLPILLRMRLAWGRRRAGPGEPAPPLELATQPNTEDSDDPPPPPYPYFYIYNTQEQSLKEAELRKRSDINPPPGPIDRGAQSTSQTA